MMRVVKQVYDYGQICFGKRPIPEIADEDFLVCVRAAGLCGSDVNSCRGKRSNAKSEKQWEWHFLEAGTIHPGYCISEVVPLDEFHTAMQKIIDRKAIKNAFNPLQ